MKLFAYAILLAIGSATAIAANPGTICVASNKYHVLIEPKKNQVRVSAWGEIVDTLRILRTQVRSIETFPSILQRTYFLEENAKIVVEYTSGETRGTGYGTNPNGSDVKYSSCYEAENINR